MVRVFGELDVGVDDGGDCLIQTGFCNVPLIDEGEFESIKIVNRASRLRRTQITSVAEHG